MAPGPQRIESKEVALTSSGSWAGMIVYFLLSVGFFLAALFKIRYFVAILVGGLFAAFGVVGMVMMIRAGSSQQRYGPMPIELEGPAPTVGGRLLVSLQLPAAATHAATPLSLRAVLTCSKVTYGRKSRRSEETLQALSKVISVARSQSGARVTFDFELPADLPHADDPGRVAAVQDKTYASWELEVEAIGGDANLSRSYDIPVGRALPENKIAAPDASEGPMEILRPLAGGFIPPAVFPPKPPVVTSSTAPKPATPLLLPDDDQKSLWVLVAINLVPLAGVLFAGWRVHEIVMLYWIENLVIGAVNVLRMRIAVPENLASIKQPGFEMSDGQIFMAKAFMISFFIVHYGGFCYVHGIFLASFFPAEPGGSRDLGGVLRAMLLNPATLVAIAGIVLSHAYSYFHNFVGRGEYLHVDMRKMMFSPYKRIVVTHLFIFAGAFALTGLGSPVAAMVAFIALKIGIDAHAHRQERAQLGAGVPSGTG